MRNALDMAHLPNGNRCSHACIIGDGKILVGLASGDMTLCKWDDNARRRLIDHRGIEYRLMLHVHLRQGTQAHRIIQMSTDSNFIQGAAPESVTTNDDAVLETMAKWENEGVSCEVIISWNQSSWPTRWHLSC